MRTSVFLGLTAIADAIRQDWIGKDQRLIGFIAIIFIVMIIMDVAEFIKGIRK